MRKFKKILGLVMVVAGILALALPVFADSYRFYVPVTVTETGGSTKTGVPILVDLNNQSLVDLGYLKATGLDTRMQEAGADRGYSVATGKLGFLVPTISAYQGKEFDYYTSYDPDNDDFGIVVGNNGYITVSDDATLELGNNFESEFKGYVDTTEGDDKNLIHKPMAYRTYISDATDITSAILSAGQTWVSPTSSSDPGEEWTNDAQAYNDNTADYAQVTPPADGWSDYLILSHSALECSKIRFYFNGAAPAGINNHIVQVYYDEDWHTVSSGVPTFDAWVEKTITPIKTVTQIRFSFFRVSGQGGSGRVCDVDFGEYLSVEDLTVTAAGVTSGEHTVLTLATGGGTDLFQIWVGDGDAAPTLRHSVALAGASVPLNGNDWILGQNNVTPYLEYYKHTVGGTWVVHYQPITTIGVALVDREGVAQNGVITWGGRKADSGTTATLVDSELTQADDYWNGYTVKVKETTDGEAPEGEESAISDFTSATLGGTADSGSATTLVDATLVQPTAYWAAQTLTIVTTTDSGAPQGESKTVTTWDLPTNTLTFPDMTAAVGEGDTYTLTAADTLFFDALTATLEAGDRYEIWDGQTILWGSFPEGISVEVGALTAYTDPVSSAAGLEDPTTAGIPQEPSGLWGGTASEDLPLYDLFNPVAVNLGWTADVLYVAAATIVSIGLGVALLITTGSALAAIGGVGVGMAGGMATGMLPVWILVVYLIFAGTWLYASRSM